MYTDEIVCRKLERIEQLLELIVEISESPGGVLNRISEKRYASQKITYGLRN